jgi:hypothetical protein
MRKRPALLKGIALPSCLLAFLLILSSHSFAQPASQTFNVSGTYTIPVGFTASVTIQTWGAGGYGGTGSGGHGGGGGGAYSTLTTTLSAGSYNVIVGAGGTSITPNGGNSSFAALVAAGGGFAGTTGTGGVGGTVITGTGFSGGNGASTSGNSGGGGGGSATSSGNGGNGTGVTGGTGQGTGGGGAPSTPNNSNGNNGNTPGGGGGGKGGPGNVALSGNGGAGRVIVTVNNFTLPVHLTQFRAYEKNGGVQFDWTVVSEENIIKYQVERSADGRSFTSIGEVNAQNAGAETKYGFLDLNPAQGVNFYRLKIIDYTTKPDYSSVLKIALDKNLAGLAIYPNPAINGTINFQSPSLAKGEYMLRILNASGQQVSNQVLHHYGGAISQAIKLPGNLTAGYYSLLIEKSGLTLAGKSFMVQ